MSDLTAKFETLEGQLTAADFIRAGVLDAMYLKLLDLETGLTTIQENNATNTRLLLNAIQANSPCETCPDVPLIGTPPSDATTAQDDEYCQRVQAFLEFINLCCNYADAVGTSSGVFTPGYITSIVGEIRTTMADASIPVPGWIDTLVLAADGVNYVVSRALLGGSTHDMFDPIREELLVAMYAGGSVSTSADSYYAGIDAADGLAAARPLLKGFGYGDVMNYFLDPASTPYLTPYDGGICSEAECVEVTSTLTGFASDGNGEAIVWPSPIVATNHTPAGYTTTQDVWATTNLIGWSYTCSVSTLCVENWAFSSTTIPGGVTHTFGNTDHAVIYNFPSSTPFTITLCPPTS